MKPFYFRLYGKDEQNRLLLVSYYNRKGEKHASFADILRQLMAEKAATLQAVQVSSPKQP